MKPELTIQGRFGSDEKKDVEPKKLSSTDHPLSRQTNSKWNQYYSDKILWEEIEKDVKRTRVEMAFFMMAVDPERSSSEEMIRLEK